MQKRRPATSREKSPRHRALLFFCASIIKQVDERLCDQVAARHPIELRDDLAWKAMTTEVGAAATSHCGVRTENLYQREVCPSAFECHDRAVCHVRR